MTKGQAALIIKEKIVGEFMRESATLRCEIKRYSIAQNNVEVEFWNGSRIFAITAGEFSRGYRGNVLIEDEFRLIKKEIHEEVLIPTLIVPRQPMYLVDPKFANYPQEDNIQIHISSAYYSSEWIYEFTKDAAKEACKGRDGVNVLAMDYRLSLAERLTTERYIERQKATMDSVSFAMEFDNIFYGQSKNPLFSYDYLKRARIAETCFRPINNIDYLEKRERHRRNVLYRKVEGEVRIIAVDVAFMGGEENDASQFICMRLIPNKNSYKRVIDYIESMEGVHSFTQAVRLKQLYEDYVADYVIMDCNGTSLSLYEQVSLKIKDTERGVEYPAWTAMNSEILSKRVFVADALPVIWSVVTTTSGFDNHDMISALRTAITDGHIELLIGEQDAFDSFIKQKLITEFADTDMDADTYAKIKTELLYPYYQTTALINELINLQYTIVDGRIRVVTKGSRRKDRFSALLYGNYFAKFKEDTELRTDTTEYETVMPSVRELIL